MMYLCRRVVWINIYLPCDRRKLDGFTSDLRPQETPILKIINTIVSHHAGATKIKTTINRDALSKLTNPTQNQLAPTHPSHIQQSREKLPTRLPTRRQPRHGQQQPHGRQQQQQRGRPHVQANGREPCTTPGSAGHHDQQCRWYEPFWGWPDGRKQWYWRRETYDWRRAGGW
jgi:hypothetical protein